MKNKRKIVNRMNTCENCGCRVYNLGCVNCNEIDYINEADNE